MRRADFRGNEHPYDHHEGPSLNGCVRILAAMLAVMLCIAWAPGSSYGQGTRKTPSESYYHHFNNLYDGEYRDAVRGFQSEARGAIKTTQSRWIDSICYETMWGECCYQMGNLKEALEHYTAALTLFRNFSDWMTKVQFANTIRPAPDSARKNVPWGMSTRQVPLGSYPTSEKLLQGQVNQTTVIQNGGIVQQANLFPVTPQEIVRCTTLAMRRRAMLLGPICKYDQLTNDLVAATGRQLTVPNHWSTCWANLERGLALAAAGQDSQAVDFLQRSVLAGGQFDHPLTSVALLELGRHALKNNDYVKASQFFEEASFAAVNYPDCGVLEEAFRYGLQAHLLANRKEFYPPLEKAIQWTKGKNLRHLQATLLLCAVENSAVMGDTRQAAKLLEETRAVVARRDMGDCDIGGRYNYLNALMLYQDRKVAEGNAALALSMEYMKHGSLWLFHIAGVDAMYVGGAATQRMAYDLYANVLREPLPTDWMSDPQETLAVLVTPHPLPYEHWFEVAIQRKDNLGSLDVAERAKRHRFFSSVDLGGRLMSLRWLFESPLESLPAPAQAQRQDLLARYPAYEQLSRQVKALRTELNGIPHNSEDAAVQRNQSQKLTLLGNLSSEQEAILREIAVRREPVTMVFPPLRTAAEIQKSLPEKHAVLAFFATSQHWYGYLLNRDRLGMWESSASSSVSKQLVAMLHELGQYQQNHELSVKDLTETKWKQPGKQLLESVLKGSPADLSNPFDELVIVPDGILWYVPFEALQVSIKGESQSLISRFRIRYAPLLSLATTSRPSRNFAGNTAIVAGKLHPRDTEETTQKGVESLQKSVSDGVILRSPLPAPTALCKVLYPRLIVLDDLTISEQDPYGWTPMPVERGKQNSTLADWLPLPWGGPDVIILPGFHTAAEDALKRSSHGIPGNEMFLSTCALMANGARTVLLSRWRMGGQTSLDLVREFAQELPNASPAEAWQRAVLLESGARLNLEAEPRVKHNPSDESPKADHPFFWAGYMLLDCGTRPEGDEGDDVKAANQQAAPNVPGEVNTANPNMANPNMDNKSDNSPAADAAGSDKGKSANAKKKTSKSTTHSSSSKRPPAKNNKNDKAEKAGEE